MGAAVAVVAPALMGGAGSMLSGLMGSGMLGQLLGGIMGGGGADGIAKAIQGFSPTNVLNAAANLINAMHGGAVKGAAEQLQREDGMPRFIQDAINKAVDQVLKKNEKPTDRAAQDKLGDATKEGLQKQMDDLVKQLVDNIRTQLGEESKDATSEATGGGKADGKRSGGSWLQAIAKAMGEVLGQKAGEMVKLSDKISSLAQEGKGLEGDAKADNAADMTAAQTELQGVSQEYKLLTETISTVLKGIGEALSTMGRKQ